MPVNVMLNFGASCGSAGEESACNEGTWVRSLGWEDPLEKGKAAPPVFWPREFHGLYSPWGHKELDTTEQLSLPLQLALFLPLLSQTYTNPDGHRHTTNFQDLRGPFSALLFSQSTLLNV